MIPNSALGMLAAMGFLGGFGASKAPSRQQVQLMRLDEAERSHVAKRASPAYHAAQAKRERKRLKALGAA